MNAITIVPNTIMNPSRVVAIACVAGCAPEFFATIMRMVKRAGLASVGQSWRTH